MAEVNLGELWEQAERLASYRVRPPAYEPLIGGTVGCVFACAVIGVFDMVAHLPAELVAVPLFVSMVFGFVVPFLYYRWVYNEHSAVVIQEFTELRRKAENTVRTEFPFKPHPHS